MPWQTLSLAMQHQAEMSWCWAAVAASVAQFYEPSGTVSQCGLADGELHRTDCCTTGAGGPCDVYGDLASSLYRVGHLKKWDIAKPSGFPSVVAEVDASRPLCARIAWHSGGAHFVALVGYLPAEESGAGAPLVAVEDPWFGSSDVPYDLLREGYNDGTWTDSYFTGARARRAGSVTS